ncbi:MAG TPA: tripartite tricarboxylate transporter substrate binding protein [Burkholderiales bacterium]|nr:tripartite tricarboxylate transporter substrate binding protein [Burkholderiales bacterium]
MLPADEAAAQAAWPSRPIRFTVPLPPGGANDLLARVFAERLQANLGQPVVVENKPGAGGNVGTEFVARQPADGYSLLLSSNTHVLNVSFFSKLPYDPIKDFEPVTLVATIPFVLTVNANLPVTNVKEFLAYARSHPGSTYATAGIGTPHHLGAELLRTMTGIEITHVPYKGAAFLVPALLTGEVTFSIASMSSLVPHFKSGKLRALAVASETRTSLLPDVPTIAEAGPLPGYSIDVWFGVLAPAGTPRPIVDRLNAEINRVLQDPQVVKDRLNSVGLSPVGTTPERYMEVMKADLVKYAKITKDAGIKPDL